MQCKSSLAIDTLVYAVGLLLALTVVTIPRAQAQNFNVAYSFNDGSDGRNPLDGLVADGAGDLFGTTNNGGATGNGTVFEFSKAGVETVLYSFAGGSDGINPQAALIRKGSTLYGTTYEGGAAGMGTVFQVTTAGKETVLYSFAGGSDGSHPAAALTLDASGNLYGTTSAGGASNNGTVFKLTIPAKGGKWTETLLYSFGTGTDGQVPVASLTFDAAGNLYSTTSAGGKYGYGTVFQLLESGSSWQENILHTFEDGNDGAVPYGGLIADKSGNFYGAATEGGSGGGGTIFELTPVSGGWTFTVLYSNPGWGISGSFRNLLMDPKGNLYGTSHCDGNYSSGTVYKLTPSSGGSWTYTSLYVFTGGSDGLYVYSNPVMERGHLYGTTNVGGAYGNGVIWEVVP